MNSGTSLVVKGSKDKVFETLTDIHGVLGVRLEKEEEGLSYLTIYSDDENEVKESILMRLTEQKIPVYRI